MIKRRRMLENLYKYYACPSSPVPHRPDDIEILKSLTNWELKCEWNKMNDTILCDDEYCLCNQPQRSFV